MEEGEESIDEGSGEEPELKDSGSKKKTKKKKKKQGNKKKLTSSSKEKKPDDDDLILEQAIAESERLRQETYGNNNEYLDESLVASSEERSRSICNMFGLSVKDALSLNPKYLNSAHELRFRFGSQVTGPANAMGQGGRNRSAANRQFPLHSKLITPRPNWPPLHRTGMSMRPVEGVSGIPTYTFEHDNQYAAAQQEFWRAVESLSPDEIGLS